MADPSLSQLFTVIKDFRSRLGDELTIKVGDEIELISDDREYGDGWYMGKNLTSGRVGLYPKVFTKEKPVSSGGGGARPALLRSRSRRLTPQGRAVSGGGPGSVGSSVASGMTSANSTGVTTGVTTGGNGGAVTADGISSSVTGSVTGSLPTKRLSDVPEQTGSRPSASSNKAASNKSIVSEISRKLEALQEAETSASANQVRTRVLRQASSGAGSVTSSSAASGLSSGLAAPVKPGMEMNRESVYSSVHKALSDIDRALAELRVDSPASAASAASAMTAASAASMVDSADTSEDIGETTADNSGVSASVSTAVNGTADEPALNPENVETWTPEQVTQWFLMLGFETTAAGQFARHKINGAILIQMELAYLKELDIASFGTRFEMYKEIEELRLAARRSRKKHPGQDDEVQRMRTQRLSRKPAAVQPQLHQPTTNTQTASTHNRQRSRSLNALEADGAAAAASSAHITTALHSGGIQTSPRPSPVLPDGDYSYRDGVHQTAGGMTTSYSVPRSRLDPMVLGQMHTGSGDLALDQTSSVYERGSVGRSRSTSRSSFSFTLSESDEEKGEHGGKPAVKSASSKTKLRTDEASVEVVNSASGTSAVAGSATDSDPNITGGHGSTSESRASAAGSGGSNTTGSGSSGNHHHFALFGHRSPERRAVSDQDGVPLRKPHEANRRILSATAALRSLTQYRPSKTKTSAFQEGIRDITPAQAAREAEHSGWMFKRGNLSIGSWKRRFFVLNKTRLAYFAAEKDTREKGLIDITSHRVLPATEAEDKLAAVYAATAGFGRYCFKLVPPAPGSRKGLTFTQQKVHYFAVDSQAEMRGWMAALMKATIELDETVPVISSCVTPTIPLQKAQQLLQEARVNAQLNLEAMKKMRERERKGEANGKTNKKAGVKGSVDAGTGNGMATPFLVTSGAMKPNSGHTTTPASVTSAAAAPIVTKLDQPESDGEYEDASDLSDTAVPSESESHQLKSAMGAMGRRMMSLRRVKE